MNAKEQADVAATEAVGLLESLEKQLKADPSLRLDISYKVFRLEDAAE